MDAACETRRTAPGRPGRFARPARSTAAHTFRHFMEDFTSFFDGADIVPPGIVEARRWMAGLHTAPPSEGLHVLCGAAIKRS